jgi:CRISPR-associated protein Csm2
MANERDRNFSNQGGGYRDHYDQPQKVYSKKIDVDWINGNKPIDNSTIDWANHFGEYLAPTNNKDKDAMTTSQIRKFFGEVKRIQADFIRYKDDVPLLSAKLAYAVGRQKGLTRLKKFYEEFDKAIKAIDGNEENYDRFVKLLESTVAFHKFHGGND